MPQGTGGTRRGEDESEGDFANTMTLGRRTKSVVRVQLVFLYRGGAMNYSGKTSKGSREDLRKQGGARNASTSSSDRKGDGRLRIDAHSRRGRKWGAVGVGDFLPGFRASTYDILRLETWGGTARGGVSRRELKKTLLP